MAKREGHVALARSRLTLAEIEQRMRAEGYDEDAIETTLAFVIDCRQLLAEAAARGELPDHSRVQ